MKKTLEIPVGEHEITVPVDWTAIEIVERVFDCNADYICAHVLTDVRKLQRRKIAEVIVEWTTGRTELSRGEVRELAITAPPAIINKYGGFIQGALLFALDYVGPEHLDKLKEEKPPVEKKPEQ